MWPAISIQSNEYVRSAIANCVCPECGGAIELHSSQKTVASYLKAQGATPSNHGQPIIAVSFAEVEGEC